MVKKQNCADTQRTLSLVKRNALALSKLHFVDEMVNHYSYLNARHIEPGDLYGGGCVGLLMGIEKLENDDPDFDRHLKSIVRREMQNDINLLLHGMSLSSYESRLLSRFCSYCRKTGYKISSIEAMNEFMQTLPDKTSFDIYLAVVSYMDHLKIEMPEYDDEQDENLLRHQECCVSELHIEEDIIRREQYAELDTLLLSILTDGEYRIINSTLTKNLSCKELAVRLGLHTNTIYTQQQRAYEKIRRSSCSERIHELLKLLA